ncbi:hypothetical protein D3C74_325510 [compost metagenome]
MRIAENQECCFGIGQFLFQIGEVDGIPVIPIDQLARKNLSLIIHDRVIKDIIDWSQHQYFLIHFGHFTHNGGNCRDDSSTEHNPFLLYLKLMPPTPPPCNCIVVRIRNHRVAKDLMV